MKNLLNILFPLLITAPLHTMERKQESDSKDFYAIMLGLKENSPCGRGCESFIQNSIINCQSTQYKTLGSSKNDLCQSNCIQDFDTKFKNDPYIQDKQLILAGVAGGAGTEINWLSQQSLDVQNKVRALIIESPVVDNSFAIHLAENKCKLATFIPFAQFIIPYLAKLYYPAYNPYGIRPIDEIRKFPNDLPVIIMHAKNSKMASIDDARRSYTQLKSSSHPNVYLFECENETSQPCNHINVFDNDPEKNKKIKALQAIYRKHNLPYNKQLLDSSENPDLNEFQPKALSILEKINENKNMKNDIRNLIDISTFLFMYYYLIYASLS